MDKYVCSVCGYVYDPKVGDLEDGVLKKTAFKDLSPDWDCPQCGAAQDLFEKDK
jgi:rubredoxin